MKSARQQKRSASRSSSGNGPADAAIDLPLDASTDNTDRSGSLGWRGWLGARAPVRNAIAVTSEQPAEADDDKRCNIIGSPVTLQEQPGSSRNTEETISSQSDESENARPPDAGVVNNVTDMEKEKQMQTAKQLKPLSDSGIAQKVDLRDEGPAKLEAVNNKPQPLATNGLGSLFGPVIEDDIKGVRSQIREMIQGELQGELGQRFSRNLRIVIRREIAAAIDDQFDRV
ncbi:hypothetical protein [Paracoccus saliphilus]|uniref:Uncharacterized protein n=2 Tax=Paracoccus saliphilus TaxID=405559 RepID=A0ABY7SCS0_9RHOB|nr:hypothetical protein [Paracoccus saliphilus]WCR03561.1 hypothetical protein JHX88_01945 [Paracoccus saliphilus]